MLPLLVSNSEFDQYPLFWAKGDGALRLEAIDYIDSISAETQQDVLKMLLGEVEYYNYSNDYNGTGFNSQKWDDFTNGVVFQVDSKPVNWLGASNMLRWFVYYNLISYRATSRTQTGEILADNENSTQISPRRRMIMAWNSGQLVYGDDFLSLCRHASSSLLFNSRVQAQCRYMNYNQLSNLAPTAYNFIANYGTGHAIEFPDWDFTKLHTQNLFGI